MKEKQDIGVSKPVTSPSKAEENQFSELKCLSLTSAVYVPRIHENYVLCMCHHNVIELYCLVGLYSAVKEVEISRWHHDAFKVTSDFYFCGWSHQWRAVKS